MTDMRRVTISLPEDIDKRILLSCVLENCDISNLKLCGSIRIEICGRKPEITVRKGKQS